MSVDKHPTSPLSPLAENKRPESPSVNGLKQRGQPKSFAFTDAGPTLARRRSSFFSEGLSETHKSFRSSTDDLLLPRVKKATTTSLDETSETTHWHSIPLGLALFPALAGIFFKNGSAIITDVTLLGLAAIFLNWALRLPWEWYHAAQTAVAEKSTSPSLFPPIVEEDEEEDDREPNELNDADATDFRTPISPGPHSGDYAAARRELRIHEISALVACFICPVLGAWLLHGIRGQLSRPSEGLVSNYNLTIFLLMAELRPLSHLMKMIQRRTLFLQKRVSAAANLEPGDDNQAILDLSGRLDELEAHIADRIATAGSSTPVPLSAQEAIAAKASSHASMELRRTVQPELDALSRAMRRYEKRMTISAIQVEARLQDLETRLKDVVVLAAAAQRSADNQPKNFVLILTNWLCALVVLPAQLITEIFKVPGKGLHLLIHWTKRALRLPKTLSKPRLSKGMNKPSASRPRSNPKKIKTMS